MAYYMKRAPWLAATTLATVLCGCVPDVQRAANDCTASGYMPETIPFSDCVRAGVSERRARRDAAITALGNLSTQMKSYSAPAPLVSPIQTYTINGRPYTCSTIGNHTSCN